MRASRAVPRCQRSRHERAWSAGARPTAPRRAHTSVPPSADTSLTAILHSATSMQPAQRVEARSRRRRCHAVASCGLRWVLSARHATPIRRIASEQRLRHSADRARNRARLGLLQEVRLVTSRLGALGHPNPGFEERARQGTGGFRGRSSGWGKPSRPAGVDPGQAALLSCPLISSASFAVFVGWLGSPSAQPRLDAA